MLIGSLHVYTEMVDRQDDWEEVDKFDAKR